MGYRNKAEEFPLGRTCPSQVRGKEQHVSNRGELFLQFKMGHMRNFMANGLNYNKSASKFIFQKLKMTYQYSEKNLENT